MNTILTKADEASVNKAAELLQAGEIVAIPTETVYGLAANALDGAAVALATSIWAAHCSWVSPSRSINRMTSNSSNASVTGCPSPPQGRKLVQAGRAHTRLCFLGLGILSPLDIIVICHKRSYTLFRHMSISF